MSAFGRACARVGAPSHVQQLEMSPNLPATNQVPDGQFSASSSAASRIAQARIERAVARRGMTAVSPPKMYISKAGQREAESFAYGAWFDKVYLEPREKSFGTLHEAGRRKEPWQYGVKGGTETGSYGGWWTAERSTLGKTIQAPRPKQKSFLQPPFATEDEVPALSKKPPRVEEPEFWAGPGPQRFLPARLVPKQ